MEVTIRGMTCAGCAGSVESQLKKLGLENPQVSFLDGTATFDLTDSIKESEVLKKIQDLGYEAYDSSNAPTQNHAPPPVTGRLVVAIVFTLPLLLAMFFPESFLQNGWFQLVLCLPVLRIALLYFGKSGFRSLRAGTPNMDVLIIVGVVASFAYSLAGLLLGLGPNYLFFETAATITTFVLIGNLIEERSVRKTSSAIQELTTIQANFARLIDSKNKGAPTRIPITEVTVGNLLQVNTGDIVPVDGEVVSGSASIDEAMISGESIPVDREAGGSIIGGTILVSGSIQMRATAVGESTTLRRIVRLVREAQSKKPSIQRIGDQVSSIFVPVVFGISILTLAFSIFVLGVGFQESLLRAIAVLVIACPCAMGLATPTAVMVGIGRAAKNGILIRGGDTLETLAQVKTLAFDKTGTLTTGRFKINKVQYFEREPDFVKSVIVGLESHSSHPIAESLIQNFRDSKPHSFETIEEQKGIGVIGIDKDDRKFVLGSYSIAKEVTDDESHNLYLLEDGMLIACLDIDDEIKTGAHDAMQFLRSRDVKTAIVSGDKNSRVSMLANELSVPLSYSEKLPDEKLKIIERLQESGPIGFVGDGVNDAPALSQAAVGISLGDATGAAIESANVIILGDNLKQLPHAMRIAKHTLLTIKQNLFWAFFYNVAAIPFAAAGYLNPMIAALAMAASDVMIIGNSLRLRKKRLTN